MRWKETAMSKRERLMRRERQRERGGRVWCGARAEIRCSSKETERMGGVGWCGLCWTHTFAAMTLDLVPIFKFTNRLF